MDESKLSVAMAAEYCRIAKSTLYNYRRQGKFPMGSKTGRFVYYTTAELDAWKEQHAAAPKKRKRKKCSADEQPHATA